MNLFQKICFFLKHGYRKDGVHQRPNTFWKYYACYPINWTWLLGSVLFICIFIRGAVKYDSELAATATLFPVIMMVYNILESYYAFQYYRMPEYLKALDGELNEDFTGTDAYWKRIHEFETKNKLEPTKRHNGVIGRKISSKTLINWVRISTAAVMLYMIIRTFITG